LDQLFFPKNQGHRDEELPNLLETAHFASLNWRGKVLLEIPTATFVEKLKNVRAENTYLSKAFCPVKSTSKTNPNQKSENDPNETPSDLTGGPNVVVAYSARTHPHRRLEFGLLDSRRRLSWRRNSGRWMEGAPLSQNGDSWMVVRVHTAGADWTGLKRTTLLRWEKKHIRGLSRKDPEGNIIAIGVAQDKDMILAWL